VPCIFGYVVSTKIQHMAKTIDFVLVSKKDCRRPGRRFVVRGLDHNGFAANYSETEHIIIHYDVENQLRVASYIQTRGSIPLFWSQKPSLAWSPKVALNTDGAQSMNASQIHM
jgi:hypothetical protein